MIRFVQIIGVLIFILSTVGNDSAVTGKLSNLSSENQFYTYAYRPDISFVKACNPLDDDETTDVSSAPILAIINISCKFALELQCIPASEQYSHKSLIPLLIDLPPPTC